MSLLRSSVSEFISLLRTDTLATSSFDFRVQARSRCQLHQDTHMANSAGDRPSPCQPLAHGEASPAAVSTGQQSILRYAKQKGMTGPSCGTGGRRAGELPFCQAAAAASQAWP